MLSDFIGRGMRAVEEWERTVVEESDTALADQLLNQLVKINEAIASTPAADISEIALKSDYIKMVAVGEPFPDIGAMEWRLIDSMMNDIARLAAEQPSIEEQCNSNR